jgi:hypothetical protein
MHIELTEQQQRALETGTEDPPRVVNPRTNETSVLLHEEEYRRLKGEPAPADDFPEIPPGIRRSKEAFFRDLPQLLANKRNERCWVAYHGDERIGIARNPDKLIREIQRRGLKSSEYYMGVIREHEPEPEEIEYSFFEYDDEDEDGPGAAP